MLHSPAHDVLQQSEGIVGFTLSRQCREQFLPHLNDGQALCAPSMSNAASEVEATSSPPAVIISTNGD